MTNIFLVAAREFRQIAATRCFWLTLLILPLAFVVAPLAQRFMSRHDADRVMIIDRSAHNDGKAIAARIELDHDREVLTHLSRYVERHHLERADPDAIWARHDQWYDDAATEQFETNGGLPAALSKIRAVSGGLLPPFDAPEAVVQIVSVPPLLAATPVPGLDAALKPLLQRADKDSGVLDYALLIPPHFGVDPSVRLWSNGQPDQRFVATVKDALSDELQSRYIESKGLSASDARAAEQITPTIAITSPPPGGGAREATLIRSILPMAASYLLMMSLMLSGSWMLQGTVEERSNKLLETVLACVTPEELMYGKLLGTITIGLSMIIVWIGCGIVAICAAQGAIADMIRPALAPLTSPSIIASMIYFFIAGYIAIAMLFLVIGSLSDSMRDAQGYLTPVLLAIILPITILIQGVAAGDGGVGIELLTWIPIWTPFAVLARLGGDIPNWEIISAGVLLATFIATEFVLLGRLFRASLLATGGRPSAKRIVQLMQRAG